MAEIGVGMLGYAFMGKAHSNAFKKIAYMTWPPPLVPRLVGIAGRNEEAVGEAAERYGYEYATTDWRELVADDRIGLFDNGGPNSLHAEPTIAAAEAGKHVVCEKPLGRDADESFDIWRRVAATGVKHLCAFNYRFVPAVRLAREMIEAGELGEIRHFRGRYLQDWGDDASLDTWRFHPDEAGSGALGDLGTHVIDLARFLAARSRRSPGFAKTFVPGRQVDDAVEAAVEFDSGAVGTIEATRLALGRRNALPVGDQRLEGLARVRHGALERAPGLSGRRRPRTRLQDRARLRDGPPVLGVLVAARTHHRLGRHVRARAPPLPRGDRRRHRRRPVRRDVRGRLPRGRGLRRDRAIRRARRARHDRVPVLSSSVRARAWPCPPR